MFIKDTLLLLTEEAIWRFWDKVWVREDEQCWEWLAHVNAKGYGRFRFMDKMLLTHRVAFFLSFGRLPIGMVLHKCDNPACCNPLHLYEGSGSDNAKDMNTRQRNPQSKLAQKDYAEIRKLASTMIQEDIARQYGISSRHVSKIVLHQRGFFNDSSN